MGIPNNDESNITSNVDSVINTRNCVNSRVSESGQTGNQTTDNSSSINDSLRNDESTDSNPVIRRQFTARLNNNILNDQTIVQLQMRDTLNASDVRRTIRGLWDFDCASFFACFFCCINMYNISRFAVLTYFFKGPFLLQFFVLSIGFGLPALLLMMSLGQYLGSGFYDMWFISPAFKGIGAAFLLTYISYGLYSSVPVAYLFVYFRDAFMATSDSAYRWSFCNTKIATNNCLQALNSSSYEYLGWSVSSYFHGRVLDRNPKHESKEMKIEISFHLCIIWIIICLTLAKGLHSCGKLLFVTAVIPIILYCLVVLRFVEQWGDGVNDIFQSTGQPFLLDSTSWLLASREAFIVWVAFSAIALNIQSHNRSSHNIMKQILVLFFLVTTILVLSSCFFASCMRTLKSKGLTYFPSSYEEISSINFLRDSGHSTTSDIKIISASNLLLGENLVTFSEVSSYLSHYQVMRFATEVFPAALSIEGSRNIGSIWAVFFYLSAIVFSLGHLIVIWGSVIDAIVAVMPTFFKLWRPLLTFITCVFAFLITLTMTSTAGIFVIYFLDFCIGSLWWLTLLYLLLQISVLIIRGRPCGTENLVTMLAKDEKTRSWLLPILTFQWNLIMPIATMILSIAFTRSHSASGLTWTQITTFYNYWSEWTKCLSTVFQITPLFLVFLIGAIQLIIYLYPKQSSGLIHERIQALFCPTITTISSEPTSSGALNASYIPDDPPPKYESPPSYSTATARQLVSQIRERISSSGSIRLNFLNRSNHTNRDSESATHQSCNDSKLSEMKEDGEVMTNMMTART